MIARTIRLFIKLNYTSWLQKVRGKQFKKQDFAKPIQLLEEPRFCITDL